MFAGFPKRVEFRRIDFLLNFFSSSSDSSIEIDETKMCIDDTRKFRNSEVLGSIHDTPLRSRNSDVIHHYFIIATMQFA